MPALVDSQDQLEKYIKEHGSIGNINPEELLFYARFVNTSNLTSFVSTISKTGNDWIVHFYGDSAVVCAATGPLSPKESGSMLECMTGGLLELGVSDIELVAFKGDLDLFSSLFLVCQEKGINILETSLPGNFNVETIQRRMVAIKKLKDKYQTDKSMEYTKKATIIE